MAAFVGRNIDKLVEKVGNLHTMEIWRKYVNTNREDIRWIMYNISSCYISISKPKEPDYKISLSLVMDLARCIPRGLQNGGGI